MALSNDATNVVLQSLKELMSSDNQCFTIEDVVYRARATSPRETIDQKGVEEVVNALLDQGFMTGFSRSAHPIMTPNGRAIVQLFVPPAGDPTTYEHHDVRMAAEKVSTATATCEPKCDDCGCEPEYIEPSIGGATHVVTFDKPLIGWTGLVGLTGMMPLSQEQTPLQQRRAARAEAETQAPNAQLPPLPTPKPEASATQQVDYLKKWNKSPSAGTDESVTLLDHLRSRITTKFKELKDLLSS